MTIAENLKRFEAQLPEGSSLLLLVATPDEEQENEMTLHGFQRGAHGTLVAMIIGALRQSPTREIIMEALTIAHEKLGKEVHND